MPALTESVVEASALAWLESLGWTVKHGPEIASGEAKTAEELDLAVRQIVSRAVASEGVVDIFAAAGLRKPDISILSDEFLAEVRGMPRHKPLRAAAVQECLHPL